jgi:hypothetical protein
MFGGVAEIPEGAEMNEKVVEEDGALDPHTSQVKYERRSSTGTTLFSSASTGATLGGHYQSRHI